MSNEKSKAYQELGKYMDDILTAYNLGTLETTPNLLLFAMSYARSQKDDTLGKSKISGWYDAAREDSRALLYDAMATGRPLEHNSILAVSIGLGDTRIVEPLYIPRFSVVSGETDHPVIYQYAYDTQNKLPVLVRQLPKDSINPYVLDTVDITLKCSRNAVPMHKYTRPEFDARFVMLDFSKKDPSLPAIGDIQVMIYKVRYSPDKKKTAKFG